jgi:hypothetical protein
MESKYKVPPFLKRDGESLLFNNDEGEFVFFVPEIYFSRKDAIILGEYVNLFGVLDYSITDKNGKYGKLKAFRYPTVFLSKPSSIEKVKDLKLTSAVDACDYRLLKYKKNDIIVVSVKTPQDVDNMEELYKLFVISGRLPRTVRYDQMHEYFIENATLNGAKYNLSLQLFGILVSEIARCKNDVSKPFRFSDMKDMTEYTAINIADVPKYVSPYEAITSQNWDDAVVFATLNDKESTSPMEKVLMG